MSLLHEDPRIPELARLIATEENSVKLNKLCEELLVRLDALRTNKIIPISQGGSTDVAKPSHDFERNCG
jgi:hypothetical protein